MYLNEPIDFLILVFVGLMAGAINTLGGGGSLLTLPALIFLGLPPSIANASNRIGILFSSISATTGYASKGVMNFPFNIYLGFSALFGSLLGAKIAIEIDGQLFNKILSILMIIVLLLIVFKPSNTQNNFVEKLHGKHLVISIFIFFLIGIYGGFINAGIGIIIMFHLSNQMPQKFLLFQFTHLLPFYFLPTIIKLIGKLDLFWQQEQVLVHG